MVESLVDLKTALSKMGKASVGGLYDAIIIIMESYV
jgi:hypothetical protein